MKVPSDLTLRRVLGCDSRTAQGIRNVMRSYATMRPVPAGAMRVLNVLVKGVGVQTVKTHDGETLCWYLDRGGSTAPTVFLVCNPKTGKWFWRVGYVAEWVNSLARKGRCSADALHSV